MRRLPELRRLDPVELSEVERVTSGPAADEFAREILAEARVDDRQTERYRPALRPRPRHRRPALAAAAVAAAAALAVALLVVLPGGGGRSAPFTTAWRAARPSPATTTTVGRRSGTWRLVDDVLSGTWQQDVSGPPDGSLACPATSACYIMAGHYPDATEGAPLESVSLYVSGDAGATWWVLPMPAGFAPTSNLACGAASDCAAGGTYQGQPVLVTTTDGGHQFTVTPLPAGAGDLYALSCLSTTYCAGLTATRSTSLSDGQPIDATFLSTGDGGATFADSPIVAGDSMQALSCSSNLDCTAVGTSDAGGSTSPDGVVAKTTDGGASWTLGALPAGFGITPYPPVLACSDALHCAVIGEIAVTGENPSQCATNKPDQPALPAATTTTPTTATTVPSPAIAAIARAESQALAQEARTETAQFASATVRSPGMLSCVAGPGLHGLTYPTTVDDIATSTDGGLTWTPDQLPTDVPGPLFTSLACPSVDQCWVAGSEEVDQQIGGGSDGDSSLLLGTTDGGATWSKVTFSVPAGAPNYDGQSYLSMGEITCPTSGVCVATGATAQSSPTAPVYRLVTPSGGT